MDTMSIRLLLTMFFYWIVAMPTYASIQADCRPSAHSCDFYSCMEDKNPCGKDGYWLSFGSYYCHSFLVDEPTFSAELQTWLQSVRLCLQQDLTRPEATAMSCGQIKRYAVEGHVGCYERTRFCDLRAEDKFWVYWYLRSSALTPEAWLQASRIFASCKKMGHGGGSW